MSFCVFGRWFEICWTNIQTQKRQETVQRLAVNFRKSLIEGGADEPGWWEITCFNGLSIIVMVPDKMRRNGLLVCRL